MTVLRKTLLISAIATLLAGINISYASSITYNVNQTIGSGGVTGDIATDGLTGILSNSDILSWNLTLNNGATTTILNNANSHLFGSGQLMATLQNLTYDFNSGNYFSFLINNYPSPHTGWCLQSYIGQCTFEGDSGQVVQIQNTAFSGPFQTLTGTQIVATAPVPVPAAAWLLGSGLLGLGGVARRKTT